MPPATPPAQVARRELAAGYLRMLLCERGRYRAYWASQASRLPPDQISQAAVARVIAEHLQHRGKLDSNKLYAYRPLKDRVSKALSGQALTPSTLALFAEAFLFSQEDARHLLSLLLGAAPSEVTDVISELSLPPSNAAVFQPHGFRIVSLRAIHEIGSDGLPKQLTTNQRIAAEADNLARLPIRFDSEFDLTSPSGRSTDLYRCHDGLYAVDILLPRTLRTGELADLEYAIAYRSPSRNDREFRRSALRYRIDDARLEVRFNIEKRPTIVWWAVWPDLSQTTPIFLEEVDLEIRHDHAMAAKHVTAIERAIIGFCWQW